jgi:hypothetical protein
MYDAIKRHCDNEASFKCETAVQRQAVESERLKLEKERRSMEEQEVFFFDYADLKVVYEFDQRHAREIKQYGTFRQGLQWKAEEVEEYEQKKLFQEQKRLEAVNILPEAIQCFDPLADVQEPPPTFRGQDERRHAQYMQMMFSMGRLHNFQKKIVTLRDDRSLMIADLTLYEDLLLLLHREGFKFEDELLALESDLTRTGLLIATFENMTRLWEKATSILQQASRGRKYTECKHCGVWEDVREATDKANFLKEETRSLLRLKFIYDTSLEKVLRAKVDSAAQQAATWKRMAENADIMHLWAYCKPGEFLLTHYGFCRVREYRQEDQMLMLTLPFGSPPAKLWIHRAEVVSADRSLQQGERALMQVEDDLCRHFYKDESQRIARELYGMRQAEFGTKEYWAYLDMGNDEADRIYSAIQQSVDRRYALTKTPRFNKVANDIVKQDVDERVDKNLNDFTDYKGPKSGRPKKLTAYDIKKLKRDALLELQESFLREGTGIAQKEVKTRLKNERTLVVLGQILDTLISDVFDVQIKNMAKEALFDGMKAKFVAERLSGLLIPQPSWMQYSSYCVIRDLWKDRKKVLKTKLELGMGQFKRQIRVQDEEDLNADATEVKLKKERILLELERQARLCAEMEAEEAQVRVFYAWELKENLRERRAMREEEEATKELNKEIALMEKMKQSVYVTNAASAEAEARKAQASEANHRRAELKALVIERRRQADESRHMEEEDEAGLLLREIDKKERAKAAYAALFGTDVDDLPSDYAPSDNGEFDEEFPYWFRSPDNWEDMNQEQKHRILDKAKSLRKHTEDIQVNLLRDEKLWRRIERKSLKSWKAGFFMVQMRAWGAELSSMVSQEEQLRNEEKERELKENLKRLTVLCRQKGEEELHARTMLRKKQELARRRDKELNTAKEWEELCANRSKTRDKLKKRITNDCKYVDTDSITGSYQRFETVRLRKKLYEMYFRRITDFIVNRAEVVATERKCFTIQAQLSLNRARLWDRTSNMKRVWRELQREELLRMKRSYLNDRGFFPKERHKTLLMRWSSWLRFFLWNRGHREAFELKYELLKGQLDLDRKFKDELSRKRKQEADAALEKKKKKGTVSTMLKHRERPLQCKFCSLFFVESQNNSFACEYHPGKYMMLCPRSCPDPGRTNMCIAHKKSRWSCCESTQGTITGCARRFHVPLDSDPVYNSIMKKLDERDKQLLDGLGDRVRKARREKWAEQAAEIKGRQVWAIEEDLAQGREKAANLDVLKWV